MDNLLPKIKLGKYQEEKLDLSISAFEAFKRLYPYFKDIFLLESLGEEGKFNRFSYIGFSPKLIISAKNKELFINGKLISIENPYFFLSKLMEKFKSAGNGYCGGLVGFFTHEATKYFELAFTGYENYDFPDFLCGFFLDGFRFDKKTKEAFYFHHGESRLKKVYHLFHKEGKLDSFQFEKLQSAKTESDHKDMVLKAKEHIKKGDIFQVVLALKTFYKISGDIRRFYAVLRQVNPAPYTFYIKFGERIVISASPELLIGVKGDKIEHFGTLAGTIRRGGNDLEDNLLAEKLLGDEKEKAEHMMLVDLARNDLGRICEFGSVTVEKLSIVKKYSHVQHLYSEVRGKLKKGENAFSALAACFPAGTLTGAPKIEAMKIIKNLEKEARGPYGGVGGYFSLNGEAMQAITIRSIFINGKTAYTQTGSGIVADSEPEKEYQEIINKQKAIEEALKLASI
ncbi:anthranilate synthase component I family protein [Candidatus Gottesmanbacteria bacterium]|nr:anthranilate synthase component I family protein [Candidatus Gottesmanbacteria bacterium]